MVCLPLSLLCVCLSFRLSPSLSPCVSVSSFLPSFFPKGRGPTKRTRAKAPPSLTRSGEKRLWGDVRPPVVGLSLSICLRLPPSTVVRLRFGPVSVPVSVPDSFRQDRVLREFARYTDLKSRSCLQPQILLTLPYLGEPHWVQPSPSALKLHFSSTQKCPR